MHTGKYALKKILYYRENVLISNTKTCIVLVFYLFKDNDQIITIQLKYVHICLEFALYNSLVRKYCQQPHKINRCFQIFRNKMLHKSGYESCTVANDD